MIRISPANLERSRFLGAGRNFRTSIGSFRFTSSWDSEVILLSQRLALKYNTIRRATLQAFFASFLLFFRFWTFSPVFLPVLSCFLLSILSYYNIEAERVLLRHFYPKSTRSYSYLIISSEVALDLEPIGTVLLFLHHDMLMVEVEVHRRTQIVVTGQAQQLLHPLLLLRHIE